MIPSIENFISNIIGIKVNIIEKQRFSPDKNMKFFPIDNLYICTYEDDSVSPKKLLHIKLFLQEILNKYEKSTDDLNKLKILQKELESVLEANETLITAHQGLDNFFTFMDKRIFSLTVIENNTVVINHGIDQFTIDVSRKKLKKENSISLPIKDGEIYAIKVGWYISIVQSKKKITPFIKQVIKSRLLWLSLIYEAKMGYNIDKLTGLYSREKFLNDLQQKSEVSHFIFINLKSFKTINQIYSSQIGDRVLKEIAEILKQNRFGFSVYRIYGDRFAIMVPNGNDLKNFSKDIIKLLEKPILLYNPYTKDYVTVTVNAQIAIFETPTNEILEKSNFAFRKSKSNIIDYENEIKPLLEEENEYFNTLLKALENDNVIPYFQKVINKESGETAYYESLMRIVDRGKVLPPIKFLEISKNRGFYKKLNYTMIRKSIEATKYLKKMVSINIDIYDVLQEDFLDFIEDTMKNNNIDGSLIQFELLETEDIYNHFEEVRIFLNKIKMFGCKIALDDFGKGYSNFVNIKDMPIDTLKIDMSLVKNIHKDRKSYDIVRTVTELSKILNMKTTVEGVGSEEIYQKIENMPINYLQGFFFDKPKSIEDIIEKK